MFITSFAKNSLIKQIKNTFSSKQILGADRNARRSVLWPELAKFNPYYAAKLGWERVTFFNVDNKENPDKAGRD